MGSPHQNSVLVIKKTPENLKWFEIIYTIVFELYICIKQETH